MTTKHKVHFETDPDEFCCGIHTAGNFEFDSVDTAFGLADVYPANDGWHSTKRLAAKSAVARMIKASVGRPIIMWFKRRVDYVGTPHESYEMDELRQVVKHTRGVVPLGVTINPGTKNHVDGYMLTAHAKKGEAIE